MRFSSENARNRPAGRKRILNRLRFFVALSVSSAVAHAAFNDAHDVPPAGWTGPVFKLSQAYPTALPAVGNRPWLQFDFKKPAEAPQYMGAVLSYCLEGNAADNFADISQNAVRKWFHTPWLDAGPKGREFIHGLTKERPSKIGELGASQTTEHDNWAVGFYNPRGGYAIGRVWKDAARPNLSKAKFPLHTVSCKLLFSTAPLTEVPFLNGSLEWEGDINRSNGLGARPKLRLLQLDFAVRDSRANATTGWVFGTFQYEEAASTSTNWWEHMVPVGLMWGNDVAHVINNQPPTDQWINPNRRQLLHLGLRGLLNGPIDNPNASCVACHGLAQIPRVSRPAIALPGIPRTGASNATITKYLRNLKAGEAFSPDYASLDYSLQLQMGVANAINAGKATLPPIASASSATAPIAGRATLSRAAPKKVRTITRDE